MNAAQLTQAPVKANCAARVPVGLIDVESEHPDVFAAHTQRLLGRCAALISLLWRSAEAE